MTKELPISLREEAIEELRKKHGEKAEEVFDTRIKHLRETHAVYRPNQRQPNESDKDFVVRRDMYRGKLCRLMSIDGDLPPKVTGRIVDLIIGG